MTRRLVVPCLLAREGRPQSECPARDIPFEDCAMYVPKHFAETDPAVLQALIQAHPFATVVAMTAGGLEGNHFPLLFDPSAGPHGTLRGHMARGNPLWREADPAHEVLAVFQGPEAYITPSWYPSKKVDGKVVPTWNYAVVHARGALRTIEDPAWLLDHLAQMVPVHESPRPEPWALTDAPADYVQKMAAAIVGFEIALSSLTGKWKVSQNRAAPDREGVIAGLRASQAPDSAPMAELVLAAHTRA
jgi:transcriptional regulator